MISDKPKSDNIKLKRIYVDGYKNIIDCETKFHDFNVLVGPNNSGKSNFLELFTYLTALISGGEKIKKSIFEQASSPRGGTALSKFEGHESKPITISFVLENHSIFNDINDMDILEVEYALKIDCFSNQNTKKDKGKYVGFISERLTAKEKSKTGRANILIKRNKNILEVKKSSGNFTQTRIGNYTSCLNFIPNFYDVEKELDPLIAFAAVSVLDFISSDIIFASADNIRNAIGTRSSIKNSKSRTTSFDIIEAIARIHQNNIIYKEFENVLCQVLDLEKVKFDSVTIPENVRRESSDIPEVMNFFQLKLHGQPFSDIKNYSDGTLVVTAILVMILSYDTHKTFFCIEEPENCLHPKALKTLISYLMQTAMDRQILITTHSPYVLNLTSPEDLIIARLRKDGSTHFEQIKNIKELRKRLDKGYISFGDLLETEFENDETLVK